MPENRPAFSQIQDRIVHELFHLLFPWQNPSPAHPSAVWYSFRSKENHLPAEREILHVALEITIESSAGSDGVPRATICSRGGSSVRLIRLIVPPFPRGIAGPSKQQVMRKPVVLDRVLLFTNSTLETLEFFLIKLLGRASPVGRWNGSFPRIIQPRVDGDSGPLRTRPASAAAELDGSV